MGWYVGRLAVVGEQRSITADSGTAGQRAADQAIPPVSSFATGCGTEAAPGPCLGGLFTAWRGLTGTVPPRLLPAHRHRHCLHCEAPVGQLHGENREFAGSSLATHRGRGVAGLVRTRSRAGYSASHAVMDCYHCQQCRSQSKPSVLRTALRSKNVSDQSSQGCLCCCCHWLVLLLPLLLLWLPVLRCPCTSYSRSWCCCVCSRPSTTHLPFLS